MVSIYYIGVMEGENLKFEISQNHIDNNKKSFYFALKMLRIWLCEHRVKK